VFVYRNIANAYANSYCKLKALCVLSVCRPSDRRYRLEFAVWPLKLLDGKMDTLCLGQKPVETKVDTLFFGHLHWQHSGHFQFPIKL